MRLETAVESDDELRGLRALRRMLAKQLDECESNRDFAALSLRFQDCMKRISELQDKAPVARSPLDEIASRRERKKPIRGGVKREA